MMTKLALLLAAVLTIAIGVAHSWIGERRLIGPLLDPARAAGLLAKSEFARGTLRFAWHVTTLAWWGMAAILAVLATAPISAQGRFVLLVIAATFGVTGLTVLLASRGRHLSWPVFLGVAALTVAPLF